MISFNYFFFQAGSGKTTLLQEIIKTRQRPLVTATTGLCAVNLNGRTVHSVLGLGDGTRSADEVADSLRGSSRDAILDSDILIIDEYSMISKDLLEKVSPKW